MLDNSIIVLIAEVAEQYISRNLEVNLIKNIF